MEEYVKERKWKKFSENEVMYLVKEYKTKRESLMRQAMDSISQRDQTVAAAAE
jgi:hypothetical protein